MKPVIKILGSIFVNQKLFFAGAILTVVFVMGFFAGVIYLVAKILLLLLIIALLIDLLILYAANPQPFWLRRETPVRFSNGDENYVYLQVRNNMAIALSATIYDELPHPLQVRDLHMKLFLLPYQEKRIGYSVKPVKRGAYEFGKTHVYLNTRIGLLERRLIFNADTVSVPVYPSFLNIRKFEFLAISNRLTEAGVKRIRKLGQHSDFDQIREYVQGDDYRTINWKTTAKKNRLMVNQYQEERAQQVYSIIDLGRTMKMSFSQMSLADYAINASLVIANTALFKNDKAGLITFTTRIHTFLKAERKTNTMARMLELLYNQDTAFVESDFDLLFTTIRRRIPQRSLLILYTNFESLVSLLRFQQYLRRLAQNHLVLVVIFENTEITEFRKKTATTLAEIYEQTIAEKFIYDKQLIAKELNKNGVLTVLSRPHDLSVNLVNRYLELKNRGML